MTPDPYVAHGLSQIERFLASPDAMELLPTEVTRVPLRGHAPAHAQPHSGWAHRIPMGNPPRRATGERGGLVRAVPRMREPWPDTAEQWQMYALCSQLDADHRRETERTIRRNHRREMQAMLKAGGVVIGCMLAMGAAYVGAWWLWALVGA